MTAALRDGWSAAASGACAGFAALSQSAVGFHADCGDDIVCQPGH